MDYEEARQQARIERLAFEASLLAFAQLLASKFPIPEGLPEGTRWEFAVERDTPSKAT